MTNIQNILRVMKSGPASPSRYAVVLQPPKGLPSFPYQRLFFDSAEIVDLPGRQFATTPHIMYGVPRKMPYGVMYQDLQITFLCANDMLVRQIFDEWHSVISNPFNNYFNYLSEYKGVLDIYKVDEQANQTYRIIVDEIWPVTIEAQQLDANVEGILRLQVRFAYRRWYTEADRMNESSAFNSNAASVFNDGGTLEIPSGLKDRAVPTTPPVDDKDQ